MQADFLPAKPQGTTKNTGVGSLEPSPGVLPNPGIELGSPVLQADSLPTELLEKPSRYKVGFICISLITNVVVVQLLCCVCLFATSWTAAHQASLPFTISLSLLKLMSIESVMPS